MNSGDWAELIAVAGVVVLALIYAAMWAVREEYQISASVKASKRIAPQPKAPKADGVQS